MLLNKEDGWGEEEEGVGVDAEQQISLPVLGPNALVLVCLCFGENFKTVNGSSSFFFLFFNDTPFVFFLSTDKCKRFLQEFYSEDENGKKVFKYGAQLVSNTAEMVMRNMFVTAQSK